MNVITIFVALNINIIIMNEENPDYRELCLFRKMVGEAVERYVTSGGENPNHYLSVSRYLDLEVVNADELVNDDEHDFYSLQDLYADGKMNEKLLADMVHRYIYLPLHLPMKKMDVLNDRMKEDFHKGIFPEIFEPYFNWKLGNLDKEDISTDQILAMQNFAYDMMDDLDLKHPEARKIHDVFIVDDPWQSTRGYGEDKYMMAYLEYIVDQLSDIHSCRM